MCLLRICLVNTDRISMTHINMIGLLPVRIHSFPFRWLCNESLPPASRRWSVEGLAYLTFDADVKEDLVQDKNALLAMCELAKVRLTSVGFHNHLMCVYLGWVTQPCLVFIVLLQSEDKTVLFAVGSTLVNCTNSYDVEKPDPQMVELAKYAKQHVPEEHPKVVSSSSVMLQSRSPGCQSDINLSV